MQLSEDIQIAHKEIYKILCVTIDFLSKHNIRYYLCGGTLLGAIRHGGFIPWDDDIDILVPRDDYEKLKELLKNNNTIENNIKGFYPGQKDHIYPFIKIRNLSIEIIDNGLIENIMHTYADIDIFPLDHMPDDRIGHFIFYFKQKFYRNMLTAFFYNDGFTQYNKIRKLIFKTLYNICGGYKEITKRIDLKAKDCNKVNVNSNYCGDGAFPNSMQDYFKKDIFDGERKHIFVDKEFNIPFKAEKYLETFYGKDYMTIPPVEKRVTHLKKFYKKG